jgi:hypothetical protein
MNSDDVQARFGKKSGCWMPFDEHAAAKSGLARGVYVIRIADGLKWGASGESLTSCTSVLEASEPD